MNVMQEQKPQSQTEDIRYQVRLSPALALTVDNLRRKERRSRAQMIEILLEEALERRQAWPPPVQQ